MRPALKSPLAAVVSALLLACPCGRGFAGAQEEPQKDEKSVDHWLFQLRNGTPAQRAEAAEALGNMGPRAAPAAPALVTALADADSSVRARAALALGRLGARDENTIAALIERLGDEHYSVSSCAGQALGEIGQAAVPALINALGRHGREVPALAAHALGTIGKPALPALLKALERNDAELWSRATEALLAMGEEKKCVDYWVARLRSGDSGQRILASRELGNLRERAASAAGELAKGISDPDEQVRRESLEALWRIHSVPQEALPQALGAIPQIVKMLEDQEHTWEGRYTAASVLGVIGRSARGTTPVLVKALGDRDSLVRAEAAEALGRIGATAEEAIAALTQKLGDEDLYVRRAASEAMGKLGAPAIPSLLNALAHDDAEVRFRAAEALGAIGAAIPGLANALSDKRATVRAGAARALHSWRWKQAREKLPDEVLPPLTAALNDTEASVRLYALWALASAGPVANPPVPQMIRRLGDEDDDVRDAAVFALARVGLPAVPKLLDALRDKAPEVRARAAEALGNGPAAATDVLEPLLAALKDQSLEVRFRAADALPGLAYRAIDRLIAALRDPDPRVRCGVTYALGMLGYYRIQQRRLASEAFVAALAGALRDADPDVRRTVAYAFGHLASALCHPTGQQDLLQAAVPDLTRVMKEDRDPTVRYRAALALMRVSRQEKNMYEQEADRIAATAEIPPYFGFEVDLSNLRKSAEIEGPKLIGSSGIAIHAAKTVFHNMPWKGRKKEDVLKLLGDPATIPGYGKRAGPGHDDPLEYRFDGGDAGRVVYTLEFKGGRVTLVHEAAD